MAKDDIGIKDHPYSNLPSRPWQVEANTTVVQIGEFCKLKSAGSPYAILMADADLTIGTDTQIIGLAASQGTQTTANDGSIDVYMPLPGVVYRAKATTSGNFNTQTKIDALVGDRVTLDVATLVHTIDENDGDGATNAFYIVGGNPDLAEVWFTLRLDATVLSGESV